jgi:O-antigen/teichoic acid export membrane protein
VTGRDPLGTEDLLGLPTAGPRAVRGGAIRVAGYLVGSALAAASSVLLLRHLGVVDFGRYVTIISLVAAVGGLTDLGLALIGQREYVLKSNEHEKRALIASILGIRLLATMLGVGLAALFALAAGYSSQLVVGTLLAGVGLVFGNAAVTLTIPLAAQLRFGAVTATEVGKQVVTACGNGLLVVAGASLVVFFGIQAAAGAAALGLTIAFLGAGSLVLPRFARRKAIVVLREAAPMGIALIVGALYMRALVVMASLLTTGFQTGLFATSYRILEILFGVPTLMIGAAFPILARAGAIDEARLAYALQRLVEITLLIAVLIVLTISIGAGPIVRILGGDAYARAAPVLRIHVFALLGSFASVVWTTGLIVVRRQSALIVTNAVGLVSIAVLGPALILWLGAKGAAVAAVGGETLLALTALALLLRARPSLKPRLGFSLGILLAAALGASCVLIPGVPDLLKASLAGVVYLAVAWAAGTVPAEAVTAWRHGGS